MERLSINKAVKKRVTVESPLDRLRAAWAEADEIDKAAFRLWVMEQVDGR